MDRTGFQRAIVAGVAMAVLLLPAWVVPAQDLDDESLERLSALGYVAGSDPAEGRFGVTIHESGAVQPGLNLMTSGHGPVALLMDMQGEVVHTWRIDLRSVFKEVPAVTRKASEGSEPPRNFWRIARLLPNGDLIVLWELYGLFKLDRSSKLLWAQPAKAHHDLYVTATGRIHHLEAKRRQMPEISGKRSVDDFLVERDADGNEMHRLAVSEALAEIDWLDLRAAFWNRDRAPEHRLSARSRFDPFHTNALQILSGDEATRLGEPFRSGDALISMAMLDTIAVVEPRSGKVRWWQQGPFGMQHSPRVTLDGKVVVFNNHYFDDDPFNDHSLNGHSLEDSSLEDRSASERSAVQVFDPRAHQATWEYGSSAREPLYSKRSGGVEVLENGNLLIVETDRGRALEVTPDKRVVWEYRSPYRVGEERDRVAGIYSMQRIPGSRTAWLEARPAE